MTSPDIDFATALSEVNSPLLPACYDREGRPISFAQMCALRADLSYKILRRTPTPQGEVVSAWLGEDQLYDDSEDAPLIFGTILRHPDDSSYDHDYEAFFATTTAALEYHDQLVARLLATKSN